MVLLRMLQIAVILTSLFINRRFLQNQGGFMIATRNVSDAKTSETSTTSAKKLRAITRGAEYAVDAAGATGVGLNALALCVTISNPIILAIAGGMGTLFCCLGTCYEWRKPDSDAELVELERKMEQKIDKIEGQLDKVVGEEGGRRQAKSSTQSNVFSIFSQKNILETIEEIEEEEELELILESPDDQTMDDDSRDEKKVHDKKLVLR